MRGYDWVREDCGPRPNKTMWGNLMVFHWYLGMHQFVWARALCGTRIWCCASVDCSGATRKINVTKIRRDQSVEHGCHHDGFQQLGTFDEAPGTVHSPGVRADAQCCKLNTCVHHAHAGVSYTSKYWLFWLLAWGNRFDMSKFYGNSCAPGRFQWHLYVEADVTL